MTEVRSLCLMNYVVASCLSRLSLNIVLFTADVANHCAPFAIVDCLEADDRFKNIKFLEGKTRDAKMCKSLPLLLYSPLSLFVSGSEFATYVCACVQGNYVRLLLQR
jgi:hypothetical protein